MSTHRFSTVHTKEGMILLCPPYSQYKEQPKDQSPAELFNCPKCKEKMWLSQKKKGMLMFHACANTHITLACHSCIIKILNENGEK